MYGMSFARYFSASPSLVLGTRKKRGGMFRALLLASFWSPMSFTSSVIVVSEIAAAEPRFACPPVVVTATQPSFVGHTACAGLAFLGKLLLLAGLLLAAAHGPLLEQALSSGVVHADAKTEEILRAGIPPGAALGVLVVGSLLLVMARRRAGVGHFVRGCVGCGLVFWTAIGAMFWAQESLAALFRTGKTDALAEPDTMIPLIFCLAPLALGVLLLLWPPAERNRPIVI